MKPAKSFDCVQMKWEIQQRLDRELAGLTPEQAREEQRRRIEEDPALDAFLRRVHSGAVPDPSVKS